MATLLAVMLACWAIFLFDRYVSHPGGYFDLAFGLVACFAVFRLILGVIGKVLRALAKPRIWIAVGLGTVLVVAYHSLVQYWPILFFTGAAMILLALVIPTPRDQHDSAVLVAPSSAVATTTSARPQQTESPNALVSALDNFVGTITLTGEERRLEKLLHVLRIRNEISTQVRQGYAYERSRGRVEREEDTKDEDAKTQHLNAILARQTAEAIAQLRVEIQKTKVEAELEAQRRSLADLKNPPVPARDISPEQEKSNRHVRSESRLQRLRSAKLDALKISDEDERVRKVNAIDDAYQREMEEWAKTL